MDGHGMDSPSTYFSSSPDSTFTNSSIVDQSEGQGIELEVQKQKGCITVMVLQIMQWMSKIWSNKHDNGNSPQLSTTGEQTNSTANHDDSFCESENIHMQILEKYLVKINATAKQIDKYRGPHFTHEYRSLDEECAGHAIRLDALHVPGMEDIDTARKRAMHQVKTMSKKLKAKVHSNGKPCRECQLQSVRRISKSFINL